MSGHSKWSTIKRQKGAADTKRSQLFTKLSNAITLAVRQGGGVGDPALNFRLRLAIEAAKASNMPKDNIERAITRAQGASASDMQEVVYEGFGPGGFSIIVQAVTDNKLRTNAEIRNIFDKHGGSFGVPGSVSYQFAQKGSIIVSRRGKTVDDIFLLAADSGAEDVEEAGEEVIIYTRPEELGIVREALQKEGIELREAKLIRKPLMLFPITDAATANKALSFTSLLEDHQDVQEVFTNFDIPDELLE
ncbi:MAG: YebC/PmpR family DNA-binding transcriptional regulator [Candidatus Levybacteria bacterium]|nr:YebC/PmpR family DNA-binding transcriptional regulator [Candidatus Levybacteria bacterium]